MRAMVTDYFNHLDLTRSVLAPRIQTGDLSIFFVTRKVASDQFPSYLNPSLFDPYGLRSAVVPTTTATTTAILSADDRQQQQQQHEPMLHCFWSEDNDHDEEDGTVVDGGGDERDLSFVLDIITLMRKWKH
jgi:hypothetical protein